MFSIYDGRESFYQWDLDRKLIVADDTINQVHFCNKTDDCSLVCEVYTENGKRLVNVPNILLQTDWKIRVYGYDTNYTKHYATFGVVARTKPTDYVYTETEVRTWDELNNKIIETKEELDNRITDTKGELEQKINNVVNGVSVTATPSTFNSIVKNAKPNTTITLTQGEYNIELKGNKAFPENLTIKGGNGAKVMSLFVASGLSHAHYFTKTDVTESIMPKGLTFTGVNFGGNFVLRNCGIEDLTFSGCYFGAAAGISICPNTMETDSGCRYKHALVRVKNLLIKGCTFGSASGKEQTAILVLDSDGVVIDGNKISYASWNGIQVAGRTGNYYATGTIKISSNTFGSTGSNPVNIANLQDANVTVIANKFSVTPKDKACVSVTNAANTTCVFNTGNDNSNTLADVPISEGNGIEVVYADDEESLVDFIVEENLSDGKYSDFRYRKWNSGFIEIWRSGVFQVKDKTKQCQEIYETVRLEIIFPKPYTFVVNSYARYGDTFIPTVPISCLYRGGVEPNKSMMSIRVYLLNKEDEWTDTIYYDYYITGYWK